VVGTDALPGVARRAGLLVAGVVHAPDEQRWFAHLLTGPQTGDDRAAA
jgi:hypothetical protein